MPAFICVTCGTHFPPSDQPPAYCPICADERQYIHPNGQQWTTLEALLPDHALMIELVEPGLRRLRPQPTVGIGQYAFLIQTDAGNLLWDCVPYLDQAAITAIEALGGIAAIAISHPHFHTGMRAWSQAFGGVPIYIHADNQPYIVDTDAPIHLWSGETEALFGGLTLIRCGGHFPGSAVVHWPAGADGRGVLLTADTIDVVADTRFVTFMYSFPNLIPLPPSAIRQIVAAVAPFRYDRLYEAFGLVMDDGAHDKVIASASRYIRAITDPE